ncbi:MAG: zinc-ribbon domain-containing protein [Candidatus Thorarchaeota archaeon]
MVKFCPKCGARALPGARFCRSCGTKLEKESAPEEIEEQSERVEQLQLQREPQPVQKAPKREIPTEKVELTQEEEQSLLIVSNIIPIQKKIEQLKRDKDDLEIKFRVEESIDEKAYDEELKKINKDVTKFEKEIEEKKKALSSVALLNLVDDVVEMRDRQDKLEEIYKEGRIQDSTYERLKKEYKAKEKETEAKVDEEEHRLTIYRKNLEYEKDQIVTQKEEFFARYQVGEFTEKEYREKIKELEARDVESLIAAVDEVISRMSKV